MQVFDMVQEYRQEESPVAPQVPPLEEQLISGESSEAADREARAIKRVAAGAFFVSLLLAVLKGWLARISGSLALMADSLDSAGDSVASFMVWVGLQLAVRRTRSFPYGLYKLENLMSLLVAVLILLAGAKIARDAFRSPAELPHVTWPLLAGVLAGVLICSLLAWYAWRVGGRTNSPTLIAEGKHRLVDVLSSTVVLCALVSNAFGFRVDRLAAMFVVVLILWTSFELLRDGMRVLLDASLDADTMGIIRTALHSHPNVEEVTFLAGRNAGRYRFVETALILRTKDLEKAHRISEEIEAAIRREVPHVKRVFIHAEPPKRESLLVAMPLAGATGTLSTHFGEAPFYGFVRLKVETGEIERCEVLANPFASVPKGKGVRVAEWLVDHKVDLVLVKELLKGKGPGYVLENAGVEVRVTDVDMMSEAIDSV